MSRSANHIDQKIGIVLRDLRERKHYSMQHVADVLDISPQQISKIERGQSRISASQLFTLCYFFQVSPSAIYQHLPLEGTLTYVQEINPHQYRALHLLDESLKAEVQSLSQQSKQHLLDLVKSLKQER